MRFIIYREEFVNGLKANGVREIMFASEFESTARRKQREFFTQELYCYSRGYGQGEILTVRAPEHDRFVGIGLIDELRPATHVVGDSLLELLRSSREAKGE
jgi:hypothetical protein